MTYIEYLNDLEEKGYLSNKGRPLKCFHCNSADLISVDEFYDCLGMPTLVEYTVKCNKCDAKLGAYSYGQWEV